MNPFEKRASEYVRDDLAFLPYVTPEPLLTFLESYAKTKSLLERLVLLIGAPGSGKTTLARLFTFSTLTTLVKTESLDQHASLTDALTKCGALVDGTKPAISGCRIPMESGYRGCWDLPYSNDVKNKLLFSLIQSRTVLAWLRGFEQAGFTLDQITLVPRVDASAALEAIGGTQIAKVREFAKVVERETYAVTASLSPPPADRLPQAATAAYNPFDVIEAFEIGGAEDKIHLRPLLICDDANILHPQQLEALVRWLARRELRIGRWILMRLDALRPHEVLRPDEGVMSDSPGLDIRREMAVIWMQGHTDTDRKRARLDFRRTASDMARRYLAQMPVFARRHFTNLEQLLETDPPQFPVGKLRALTESIATTQRLQIGQERRREISGVVDQYFGNENARIKRVDAPELRAAMERILIERYLRRVPQGALFDEGHDPEPNNPLSADRDIELGARLQLHHQHGRPMFYGFEALCDAASENAERFLHLASPLVTQLEAQLIRDGTTRVAASTQDRLLRERADRILKEEDFPERTRVLKLADHVAAECLEKSLEPNASLGQGANAWGIPQDEFDQIPNSNRDLARVLQYGTAYNIFGIIRDYGTKKKVWTLIELTGTYSLARGLTLGRGGFLERRLSDLLSVIEPSKT
jgi:hypothetical protein